MLKRLIKTQNYVYKKRKQQPKYYNYYCIKGIKFISLEKYRFTLNQHISFVRQLLR